jgi:hypothetical protein
VAPLAFPEIGDGYLVLPVWLVEFDMVRTTMVIQLPNGRYFVPALDKVDSNAPTYGPIGFCAVTYAFDQKPCVELISVRASPYYLSLLLKFYLQWNLIVLGDPYLHVLRVARRCLKVIHGGLGGIYPPGSHVWDLQATNPSSSPDHYEIVYVDQDLHTVYTIARPPSVEHQFLAHAPMKEWGIILYMAQHLGELEVSSGIFAYTYADNIN